MRSGTAEHGPVQLACQATTLLEIHELVAHHGGTLQSVELSERGGSALSNGRDHVRRHRLLVRLAVNIRTIQTVDVGTLLLLKELLRLLAQRLRIGLYPLQFWGVRAVWLRLLLLLVLRIQLEGTLEPSFPKQRIFIILAIIYFWLLLLAKSVILVLVIITFFWISFLSLSIVFSNFRFHIWKSCQFENRRGVLFFALGAFQARLSPLPLERLTSRRLLQ